MWVRSDRPVGSGAGWVGDLPQGFWGQDEAPLPAPGIGGAATARIMGQNHGFPFYASTGQKGARADDATTCNACLGAEPLGSPGAALGAARQLTG